MLSRKKTMHYRIKILVLFVLILCGCSGTRFSEKSAKSQDSYLLNQKPKVTADVVKFIDLREVDMDNDGKKEIVAIYYAGLNLRGVKILKVDVQAEKNVIFTKVFNTNDLRFEERKGLLTLIAKDQDSAGCGLNKFYVWDGTDFCQTI